MMKILLKIILTMLLCGNMFSQTKQELINAIKKINVVDDGSNSISSNQDSLGISRYNAENFEKLKKNLSEDELLKLSSDKHTVLRAYAIEELIYTENKNFDVVKTFRSEVEKNQTVETATGCIVGSIDKMCSIVYNDYWNHIGEEKRNKDLIMQKLDSTLICSKKNLYWLLYLRAFENGKQNDSLLLEIERLAFKKNNSYAIEYLTKYYPEKYSERIKSYFLNDFLKAKFKSDENDVFYFHDLIKMLLDTNDAKMKLIAIKKLKKVKKVKIWKNHRGWFEDMLSKHKIYL